MYGPLLITIILVLPLLFCILWCAIPYPLYKKWDSKCYYTNLEGQKLKYYIDELSTTNPIEEEKNRLNRAGRKKRFWYKVWSSHEEIRTVLTAILSIALCIFLLISIIWPITAKKEYVKWEEFAPMAQETFDGAHAAQQIVLVDKLVEYNAWLAEARASQKLWGSWSQYYYCDLSNLEYITLNSGGK